MRRLGLAYNPTKPDALALRDRALAWASGQTGLETWQVEASEREELLRRLPGSDALVVLGGDGTFLRAARALAEVDVPVLGVNSGRVGFLSKVEPDGLEPTLELLRQGAYSFEERMMLRATIRPGSPDAQPTSYAALNDAAIVRGAAVRVVRLEVLIDASRLATYVADGLVVSTPTGSTAYSFSAGGPILGPTARNLVVTPIAAYLSSIRSIVVGPEHSVLVRVLDGPECVVSIDGRDDHPLSVGDAVEIRAIERPLRFIEPRDALPFWDLLRRKAALLPG